MDEYIKKEDIGLTDFDIVLCKGDYKEALKMLLDKIENLPAADVVERKKGKWESHLLDNGSLWANYCSECHAYLPYGLDWEPNFCPHCGADMREDEA